MSCTTCSRRCSDWRGVVASRRTRTPSRRAATIAREHHFFHWELEFPEVFFDREGRPDDPRGGFDAVIGNPPWDVLRADTGDLDNRSHRARSQQRTPALLPRCRASIVIRAPGHFNRYQLFLERALQLTRPGGRIGLVLPSGLATDRGSGPLRRALLDQIDHRSRARLQQSRRQSFRSTGTSSSFCLTGRRRPDRTDRLDGILRTHSAVVARRLAGLRQSTIRQRRAAIALSRGSARAMGSRAPVDPIALQRERSRAFSVQVSASMPPLGGSDGMGVQFGRELNATEDRPHFVTLLDARAPTPSDGRRGQAPRAVSRARRELSRLAIPSHVVRRSSTRDRTFDAYGVAYRDVASATNRLTLIAAHAAARHGLDPHGVLSEKRRQRRARSIACWRCSTAWSPTYLVRLQVTTHVSTALMLRLPVPRPPGHDPAFRRARPPRPIARPNGDRRRRAVVCANQQHRGGVVRTHHLAVRSMSWGRFRCCQRGSDVG